MLFIYLYTLYTCQRAFTFFIKYTTLFHNFNLFPSESLYIVVLATYAPYKRSTFLFNYYYYYCILPVAQHCTMF